MVAETNLADRYRAQVEGVVQAVEITSATRYTWFGVPSPTLPSHLQRALHPGAARGYLLYQLQAQLYRDFYCAGGAVPSSPVPGRSTSALAGPFVERLQHANTGQGYSDPGWQVLAAENTTVVVSHRGLILWVAAADCQAVQGTLGPATLAGLRLSKDLLNISPGYYMALSDTPLFPAPGGYLVRLYWNVSADGAVPLVAQATPRLNAAGIPFKLKVVAHPEGFQRADAAVLYIRREDYARVATILSPIYAEVQRHLRPAVPALTKPLAPGLGLAEDPGPGESFGLNRSALLADGLLRAHECGAQAVAARVQQVVARFAEAGTSIMTPFLRPGSQDCYPFEGLTTTIRPPNRPRPPSSPEVPDSRPFLETARAIGRRLVENAVWEADQCNWIGAAFAEPGTAREGTLVYRALGPDLYTGTSGVGLFLAELYAVTSDPTVGRTARGALQQALTQANRLPPRARFGLYTGWVGLAYAAVRSGLLLHDEALIAQATRLLRDLRQETTAPGHDLLSGSAGAIIGLLALARVLPEPTFQQFAVQLGTALVAAADRQPKGYSWRGPGSHNHPNLTGLSHGAAGIGLALLELFAATGDAQFRAAGEAAYAYEQSWFDPLEGNWPDFRFARAGRRGARSHAFSTYWCHGAPGIALSRLRAYELLGERCYAEQAAVARQTTERALLNTLSARFADCSLCHGVIGNAEVLLRCAQILPLASTASQDLVNLVARTGITQYEAAGHPWPGGVPGGYTPGLMLGLAGTALFYLRLHHPATPSVLFIPASSW
jgi:hypothetical protein